MPDCLSCNRKCQDRTKVIDVCQECKLLKELFIHAHSKVCWDCYEAMSTRLYKQYLEAARGRISKP